MERRKKCGGSSPDYPDVKAFVRRYCKRAGVGLVVGLVGTSSGCDWLLGDVLDPKPPIDTGYEIDGMIAETAETWTLQLPVDGPRDVYFADPWGFVRYRVVVMLDGGALYDWLYQNSEAVMAAVDAALTEDPVTDYEHDDGYDAAEDRIATAIMHAYRAASDDGPGHLLSVELAIIAYEDEDDILGDTESAR